MSKSIEDTGIALIGAGNLASNLAKALYGKNFRIVQVYSRTAGPASSLAGMVGATWTTDLQHITGEAGLYIVALKDAVLPGLLPAIAARNPDALFVHTAGSIPMDAWKDTAASRYGVFYPLQTFSRQREVDFAGIPVFTEANLPEDAGILNKIAERLSGNVLEVNSEQRKNIHLAAVFACNFTNHIYTLAADILRNRDLPFDILLPLIDETVRKAHDLSPESAQTGPAVRYDKNVMAGHLELLESEPDKANIYRILSESIHNYSEAVKNDKNLKE